MTPEETNKHAGQQMAKYETGTMMWLFWRGVAVGAESAMHGPAITQEWLEIVSKGGYSHD